MKRLALACLMILIVLYAEAQSRQQTFLGYLLGDAATPPILSSILDGSGQHLLLARARPVGGSDVYEKAVVYSELQGKLTLYLLILGPWVFGADGNALVDVSEAPGVFWGWKIAVEKERASGKEIGIRLDWFADGGKRTTDPIELVWDAKKNGFRVWTIDPAQY